MSHDTIPEEKRIIVVGKGVEYGPEKGVVRFMPFPPDAVMESLNSMRERMMQEILIGFGFGTKPVSHLYPPQDEMNRLRSIANDRETLRWLQHEESNDDCTMDFSVTMDIIYGTQPPGPPYHRHGKLRHSTVIQLNVWACDPEDPDAEMHMGKAVGTAICSPEDEYDVRKGEYTALTRAVGQFESPLLRVALWKAWEESLEDGHRDERFQLGGRFEVYFDLFTNDRGEYHVQTEKDRREIIEAARRRRIQVEKSRQMWGGLNLFNHSLFQAGRSPVYGISY